MQQDRPERPSHITPSGFKKVMTSYGLTERQERKYQEYMDRDKPLTDNMKKKVEKYEAILEDPFSQTAKSYAEEIVQRMMGVDIDQYVSSAMEWGIENEPFAIELYQEKEVTVVEEKSRFIHPEYDYISGEPDGLIAEDGLIEVKCPNSSNHFKNLRNGEQVDKYMYQMQGYMWITDRQWCDFVSYDPRYPEKYQLYVQTIERDQELIDTLEERCIEFWDELVIPIKEEMTE